jgi:hypothetical protein
MKHLLKLALACACALTLGAQTKDYGRDFRGVMDANQSTRARPFRIVGSTPSGACTQHEWAWSTTAASLYYCPSGTWAVFPFVTLTGTETLTNKTLTAPAITLPVMGAYTVAGLPAAGTANRLAIVTDAATPGSCTSGGGSARSLCRDTGSAWEGIGDGGSGGGGGATSFSGLTDCKVTRSSNVYSIAACDIAIGGTRYALSASSATLTGASGSSTLYFYLDKNGVNVGHVPGATISCSGCTERTGITAFPAGDGVVELATATYTLPSTFADPTEKRQAFARSGAVSGDSFISLACSSGECVVSMAKKKISWIHRVHPVGNPNYGTYGYNASMNANASTQLAPDLWSDAGAYGFYYGVLKFSDGASNTAYVNGTLDLPESWDGGAVTVGYQVLVPAAGVTDGMVARFELSTICPASLNGALYPGTFGSATNVDITFTPVSGASLFSYLTTVTLPTSGCAAGSTLVYRTRRVPPDAADTATSVNVGLHALIFRGLNVLQ